MTGRGATARLLDALGAGAHVETAATETVVRRHVDTFDWRLWRSGARLTFETVRGATAAVWEPAPGRTPRRVSLRYGAPSADAIPPGPIRAEIVATAGGRALLEVGCAKVRRRPLRIVDADGRTRVRVWLETVRPLRGGAPAGATRRFVAVGALLGFGPDAGAAVERVRQVPGLEPVEDDDLAWVVAASGREPGDYTSKIAVELRPADSAERAVRRILARLAETLVANVEGTVRGLDTEFLHDLRVATRRTRTCLGQLRPAVPAEVLEAFSEEFRWLAAATNLCRDLDVFVEKLSSTHPAGNDERDKEVGPLLDRLRAARANAHRELADVLRSERFAKLLSRWRRTLRRRFLGAERAEEPVLSFAAERTLRAYQRLSAGARGLEPDAPADELHRLRIDAKKLRYLLEFFASLWNREEAGSLVAELKLVQDSLGDYHDAWLQVERLTALAPEVLAAGAGAPTLLRMGRMVADLERRRLADVREALDRLQAFAAAPVRRRFEALVAAGMEP